MPSSARPASSSSSTLSSDEALLAGARRALARRGRAGNARRRTRRCRRARKTSQRRASWVPRARARCSRRGLPRGARHRRRTTGERALQLFSSDVEMSRQARSSRRWSSLEKRGRAASVAHSTRARPSPRPIRRRPRWVACSLRSPTAGRSRGTTAGTCSRDRALVHAARDGTVQRVRGPRGVPTPPVSSSRERSRGPRLRDASRLTHRSLARHHPTVSRPRRDTRAIRQRALPGQAPRAGRRQVVVRLTATPAESAKCVDRCCVATDDDRVIDAVKSFNGRVVRTPRDCADGFLRGAHAYRLLVTCCVSRRAGDFARPTSTPSSRWRCDEAFIRAHHIETVADLAHQHGRRRRHPRARQ